MTFKDELVEEINSKEERRILNNLHRGIDEDTMFDDSYRMFDYIETKKGVTLSIQASRNSYCNPRITVEDINEYNSFELCIISEEPEQLLLEVLDDKTIAHELEKYRRYDIYAYVPELLIQELYEDLNNI